MTGHGLRLELDRAHRGAAELVVPAGGDVPPGRHTGPGGLVVEVTPKARDLRRPRPPSSTPASPRRHFIEGRAGLLYRDLLPSRLGGRWIASHIRAAPGGPVEDRVHHHRVRLQLIYCLSGEAELVYEEQGPPFTFRAGDLVLQPPGLRHRVLAVSDGFEVVEIASPAWHPTSIDHDMALPSADQRPTASAPASDSSMPSPTGVRPECWLPVWRRATSASRTRAAALPPPGCFSSASRERWSSGTPKIWSSSS